MLILIRSLLRGVVLVLRRWSKLIGDWLKEGRRKMHTRNFTDEEFVCRCGRCGWSQVRPGLVAAELMAACQRVRDAYGGPVRVSSGRRCHSHNQEVGGVSNGYHTRGLAADLVADDMERLYQACVGTDELKYIEAHDSYIHVDIGRERKQRVNDRRTVSKRGVTA